MTKTNISTARSQTASSEASGVAKAPASSSAEVFPVAYAMRPGPNGNWLAYRLENVIAEKLVPLEPNGREEGTMWALARMTTEIERTHRKGWK